MKMPWRKRGQDDGGSFLGSLLLRCFGASMLQREKSERMMMIQTEARHARPPRREEPTGARSKWKSNNETRSDRWKSMQKSMQKIDAKCLSVHPVAIFASIWNFLHRSFPGIFGLESLTQDRCKIDVDRTADRLPHKIRWYCTIITLWSHNTTTYHLHVKLVNYLDKFRPQHDTNSQYFLAVTDGSFWLHSWKIPGVILIVVNHHRITELLRRGALVYSFSRLTAIRNNIQDSYRC